ncbi:putative pantetheine hydrolase [Saccharothrix saharensis]|uniref:Putative pantetheine hydrolase n=1 Tax=Saccharothrix saharensis TaxID=571190 RepID=A0A543JPU3_9PSEU|nr:P1 family peptidase [Saccharothrix saharensis]TQM84828.1 putative pantetheine hydrolase [Saccharothrix saharensis]
MRNAITDVPGVLVGHATRIGGGALTGVTAVLFPAGSVSTVDVRGGAPATRDTAALDPRYGGREVRGVVLAGGSAYGLAAADGAAREVGSFVPAAALFDLGRGGDFSARPGAEEGAEAVRNAGVEVAQGNVGAGTGALNATLKGGLGTASAVLPGGVAVGAVAALNAVGPSVDVDTGLPFATHLGLPGEFPTYQGDDLAAARVEGHAPPFNTVIGAVATNARLPHLFALANAAQDGLAAAVRPAHGLTDGDTVFATSTGTHDAGDVDLLLAAARAVFARALVHGLLRAESVTTPWGRLPAYRELYPRTAATYRGN